MPCASGAPASPCWPSSRAVNRPEVIEGPPQLEGRLVALKLLPCECVCVCGCVEVHGEGGGGGGGGGGDE